MALNKAALEAGIKDAQNQAKTEPTIQAATNTFASVLAFHIDIFVKSGQVSTIVNTTGSPSVHTGTGVGSVT